MLKVSVSGKQAKEIESTSHRGSKILLEVERLVEQFHSCIHSVEGHDDSMGDVVQSPFCDFNSLHTTERSMWQCLDREMEIVETLVGNEHRGSSVRLVMEELRANIKARIDAIDASDIKNPNIREPSPVFAVSKINWKSNDYQGLNDSRSTRAVRISATS